MIATICIILYIIAALVIYFIGNIYVTVTATDEDYEWHHGWEDHEKFRNIDCARNIAIIVALTWIVTLPGIGIWYGMKNLFMFLSDKSNEIAEKIKTTLKEKNVL